MPMLSVLTPFYNQERFLGEAVDSILRQSFTDFELILIDDGSTDGSLAIAESCAADKRVKIVRHESCTGIARALRSGLAMAEGAYIARHDSDDWSFPHRFSTQTAFLDTHPAIAMCGSFVREVLPEGGSYIETRQSEDAAIKIDGLFRIPLLTTTTMARRDVFMAHGCQDESAEVCGDYRLYAAIFEDYTFHNIPECLMAKRVHAANHTRGDRGAKVVASNRLAQAKILTRLGLDPGPDEMDLHGYLATQSETEKERQPLPPLDEATWRRVCDWAQLIEQKNARCPIFDPARLANVLQTKRTTLQACARKNELSSLPAGPTLCRAQEPRLRIARPAGR